MNVYVTVQGFERAGLQHLASRGTVVHPTFVTNSLETLTQMAEIGIGRCFYPANYPLQLYPDHAA